MKTKILRNKQRLTLLSYSVYRCLLDVHIMHYKHNVAPRRRPRVLGTQTARIKKGLVCSDWLELKGILKCPKSGKQIHMYVKCDRGIRLTIDACAKGINCNTSREKANDLRLKAPLTEGIGLLLVYEEQLPPGQILVENIMAIVGGGSWGDIQGDILRYGVTAGSLLYKNEVHGYTPASVRIPLQSQVKDNTSGDKDWDLRRGASSNYAPLKAAIELFKRYLWSHYHYMQTRLTGRVGAKSCLPA